MEIIHITNCKVGDVIRYKSSRKPYIVASKTPSGYFLFSKTQQYDSTINNFEVMRIIKGNNELPGQYEDEELNQLLAEVKNHFLNKKISFTEQKQIAKVSAKQSSPYPLSFTANSSEILLEVSKRTICFDRWNGIKLTDMFGKVTVSYEGIQMFAELAIMKQFVKEGWEARWIEVYGRPNLEPIFLTDWIDDKYRNQVHHRIENEKINKILSGIAKNNCNSFAGCWDVIGWKDDSPLFVEAKWSKKDKIRPTQIGWLNAGLKYGLKLKNFLIVEWDFTP